MVSPITPISVGSIRPTVGINQPVYAGSVSNSFAPDSSSALGIMGTSQAISQIQAAVSELLEGIGGGLQNDQFLRSMITLLILMALLGQMQDQGESTGSTGSDSGQGASEAGYDSFGFATYTSTTILIEYTTTTAVFGTFDQADTNYGSDLPQAQGSQIDLDA